MAIVGTKGAPSSIVGSHLKWSTYPLKVRAYDIYNPYVLDSRLESFKFSELHRAWLVYIIKSIPSQEIYCVGRVLLHDIITTSNSIELGACWFPPLDFS